MKEQIISLINAALQTLQSNGQVPDDINISIYLEQTKNKQHGDLATNLALTLAKSLKQNPRDIAQLICSALPESTVITKTEIAGPGFINFFLDINSQYAVIQTVLEQDEQYGRSSVHADKRVLVEFVSANPTGPLHVGHGRGAAYGACIADLLAAVGYQVEREYYVNDAGRQIDILTLSIFLRYLTQCDCQIEFPQNAYQGDYINHIASLLHKQFNQQFVVDAQALFMGAENTDSDEKHIDLLITNAKKLLEDQYQVIAKFGLQDIRRDIEADLAEFNVHYQTWFSERSLVESGEIDQVIDKLKETQHVYSKEGALWFRSTAFGDDLDRVLVRENGQTTYFASDIAYHVNKFSRGFDQIINVWGADHHGYVSRVKASLQALGYDAGRLIIRLVQFANLYRGQERLAMSTRSGSFVTLRQLRDEVGSDAARFYYVARKSEQHMDFDLELAVSKEKENVIYYIQYAHARVCRVLDRLQQQGWSWHQAQSLSTLNSLVVEKEKNLISMLARYPEVIMQAAEKFEPHHLTHFLRELASTFHGYYDSHKILIDDEPLRNARLALSFAVQQVIANGLTLLGVAAPTAM